MLAVSLQRCFDRTLSSCRHSEADRLDEIYDKIALPPEGQWPGNICLPRAFFPQRDWAGTVHGGRDGGAWSTVHLEMLTFEGQKQTSTSEPCSPVVYTGGHDKDNSGSDAIPSSVRCGPSPTEIQELVLRLWTPLQLFTALRETPAPPSEGIPK